MVRSETSQEKAVAALLQEWGVSFTHQAVEPTPAQAKVWPKGFHYRVELARPSMQANIRIDFHKGSVYVEDGKPVPPSAGEVLYSLDLDATSGDQSFESFCEELGYDSDSRKTYALWKKCLKIHHQMKAMFAHEEREVLRKILEGS